MFTKGLLHAVFLSILLMGSSINTLNAQSDKDKQEVGLLIYNCGLGGVTSGIGAVINKRKNEKALPTFWRGFKYGTLGGCINYGGKRITYMIAKNYGKDKNNETHDAALLWAWPAKIVHSVGSSIMENAAANKPNIFEDYNVPIGFINLSISLKNKISIQPQLMPISFGNFLLLLSDNSLHLQMKESALLGIPYFNRTLSRPLLENDRWGLYYSNCIIAQSVIDNSTYSGYIKAHEYVHALQNREYYVFNQYFNKPFEKVVNTDNKIVKNLIKYVYPDLHYMGLFYGLMEYSTYKNHFELEAEHFATNSYISP